MKLSRRDRAAMVLALEKLRHYGDAHPLLALRDATRTLEEPMCKLSAIAKAARSARYEHSGEDKQTTERKLRARLALLLRTLLRADAGDFGPVEYDLVCTWCRRREPWTGSHQMVCVPFPRKGDPKCWGSMEARRSKRPKHYTPLWTQAPPHAPRGDRG